ncbi:hypothetical protein [Luteolibacter marinus]|uniref:hypothetical protein n=1 Tax=Luteolibacter marinus TaxID=2776705 RepID=UPI001867F745|nr:hypothetical protein [Luteolibacter marinus]
MRILPAVSVHFRHRLLIAWLGLSGLAMAAPIDAERVWTGTNGKTIRASLFQILEDGELLELATGDGKIVRIKVSSLAEPDRNLVEAHLNARKPKAEEAPDLTQFQPTAEPVRDTLPAIDPAEFAIKSNESLSAAFVTFLLWWEQEGVLPIPKRGDLNSKVTWARKRMLRYCDDRNSLSRGLAGIGEYFRKELENVATYRAKTDHDMSPANLARCATGANAVILSTTLRYKNGAQFSHSVSLASATAEGKAVIYSWGKKFTGQIKVMKADPKPITLDQQTVSRTIYEFEISNRGDLPTRYQDAEVRILLDPGTRDGILLVKPFVYGRAGHRAPAPPDPLFDRRDTTDPPLPPAPDLKVPAEIRFVSGVPVERTWHLGNGSKVEGRLTGATGPSLTIKGRNGKVSTIEESELTQEDRAIVVFWRGTLGAVVAVPRLELTYRLTRPKDRIVEIKVDCEGPRCRVTLPGSRKHLVLDIESGAFLTRSHPNARSVERVTAGKFAASKIFPAIDFNLGTRPVDRYQTFYDGLPGTRWSNDFPFPSRSIVCPFNTSGHTVKHPRVDYSRVDAPAVMTGLYQLLAGQSALDKPGPQGSPIVFSDGFGTSFHQGFQHLLPVLRRASMLPLRIEWTNDYNRSILDEELRQEMAGKFLLELVQARVPDGFPDDHFDLPAEANAAEPGTFQVLSKP